jgi:class 3 adenylate cyclase
MAEEDTDPRTPVSALSGQRRLAAILAADVVGYTRLMESDEEATRARLMRLRDVVFEPTLKRHGGRVVKVRRSMWPRQRPHTGVCGANRAVGAVH